MVPEAARRIREGPARNHLGHHAAAEEDEDHRACEFGRQLTDQSGPCSPLSHGGPPSAGSTDRRLPEPFI
ncbi:hypothetical protein GCM10010266_31660 [Streptomyces griseomycini]|nr:hypothetical protein GCM10010266_31660 [Streptomyces griseomycini]